jgi:spermidine/putrescine transport system ATP-binding protein
MSADVELKNVSVTFGSFYAAKNVDVKVNGGEFFSFLGPSGCGKTTLLRAISGFQDPSEGEVLIEGKNMIGIGPNKRPTALINFRT